MSGTSHPDFLGITKYSASIFFLDPHQFAVFISQRPKILRIFNFRNIAPSIETPPPYLHSPQELCVTIIFFTLLFYVRLFLG